MINKMKYNLDHMHKDIVVLEGISVFSLGDRISNNPKSVKHCIEISENRPFKHQKLHEHGKNALYDALLSTNDKITSQVKSSKKQDALIEKENLEILLDTQTRAFRNSFKNNIDNLDLNDKETLFFIIDRNLQNCVVPPADIFAYSKLNKMASLENLNVKRYDRYNCLKINHIHKLSKKYDINSKPFLKHNTLLPGSIAYYLTPFFFDIFSMNNLKGIDKKTVKFMLYLKKSYTQQKQFDSVQLNSNIQQNILWNCIALNNLKFVRNDTMRMGMFNTYLCFIYVLTHTELLITNSHHIGHRISTAEESKISMLKDLLPFLLDALILNGHFTQSDYYKFKQFALIKLRGNEENIETNYYRNSLKYVTMHPKLQSPLNLSSLCRITIKDSIKKFNRETLAELKLSKATENFLMFENELNHLLSFINREKETIT